ncbi:hypothetical protein, partial [Enterobacter cloacae complex sp. CH23B]|uniref:hypothetical protein n=1 Tax=Enterobacter cloacae complex sp. CH23B TaxID=2511986 RepID=UPI0010280E36
MGDTVTVDTNFKGQQSSVTPLIGKLRLHVQSYVNKEYFFISPLQDEDAILGVRGLDCMAANIKFPKRRIYFTYRGENMYIDASKCVRTTPLVNPPAFDNSMKSSVFAYMIFVKGSLKDPNVFIKCKW